MYDSLKFTVLYRGEIIAKKINNKTCERKNESTQYCKTLRIYHALTMIYKHDNKGRPFSENIRTEMHEDRLRISIYVIVSS